ncbi:mechanosensitive ion channel [bacterium]|nr:mechanosensitive ion channel [bacterium]
MTPEIADALTAALREFATRAITLLPTLTITLVAFYLLYRAADGALRLLEKSADNWLDRDDTPSGESEKRLRTLFGFARRLANFLVLGVGVLVVLQLFGVQIGPILAAAGVVGLAVSFGAQSLVKDVIAGTFILIENQIRVGDVAVINGQGGLVEHINLRTVVLRDLAGVVHVFPNGSIEKLANMTKDWSAAVLDIGVAYKEDIDEVIVVIRKVATEMRETEQFGPKMLDDIEVFGVDSFGDSAVTIKCRLKTLPIEQWNVGREYRRRLKYAFDEAGIEIPFPHRTLYFGEASKPIELLMRHEMEKSASKAKSDPSTPPQ